MQMVVWTGDMVGNGDLGHKNNHETMISLEIAHCEAITEYNSRSRKILVLSRGKTRA